MASNHQLTALIKGRTVTAVEPTGTTVAVHFDDGSVMTVQTAAGSAPPSLPAPGAPGTPAAHSPTAHLPAPHPPAAHAAARTVAAGPQVGAVQAVRQQGTSLALELEGGATLAFQTAEPTSSVLLRDKTQRFEYSD